MAAPIPPTMPLMRHSIDLKANGEVSRMRNHKGKSSFQVESVKLTVVIRKYAFTPSDQILFALPSEIHSDNPPQPPPPLTFVLHPCVKCRTQVLTYYIKDTNERLHRCNVICHLLSIGYPCSLFSQTCNAEFTRSDLLTRHKRTCGDS